MQISRVVKITNFGLNYYTSIIHLQNKLLQYDPTHKMLNRIRFNPIHA